MKAIFKGFELCVWTPWEFSVFAVEVGSKPRSGQRETLVILLQVAEFYIIFLNQR